MDMGQPAIQQRSGRFADNDADVELLSSDGVLFKVHRANLAAHSAIFPGTEMATNHEIVALSESSEALDIILQYIYPRPPCRLDALPFSTVYQIAEAAEKYQFFAVMEICRLLLQTQYCHAHPLDVLTYACKHDYGEIADRAAPLTMDVDPRDAFKVLGHMYFSPWMLYREQWIKVQLSLPTYMDIHLGDIKQHWGACDERWYACQNTCKEAVVRGDILRCLQDPDAYLSSVMAIDITRHCPGCTEYWNRRRDRLRRQVAEVEKFTKMHR